MKVLEVKVDLTSVVKVKGLDKLNATEVADLIANIKDEFCVHSSVQTRTEYIGYKKVIKLVRCKDEPNKDFGDK